MTKPLQINLFDSSRQHTVDATKSRFKAIDLFAGIGGIRLGFANAFKENIEFVFSSEIDKYAVQTYTANFDDIPYGDITKIDEQNIPSHDILMAGFPCQAFSLAGHRKGFLRKIDEQK